MNISGKVLACGSFKINDGTQTKLEHCPRNKHQVVDDIRYENTHITHTNTIKPILIDTINLAAFSGCIHQFI
jgi:hypothetical protein